MANSTANEETVSRKVTMRLQADRPGDPELAARLLAGGGTVAFPTETVYGLGADALQTSAIAAIFRAKDRPSWDPLIVHVSDRTMLARVAVVAGECGRRAERLMEAFWPGPLTLLLPRTEAVPHAVTAGRSRVGVRLPAHPVARALIASAGVPVAAPSANRFGHTSPTTAAHVLDDLDGRIDAVLDGGASLVGVESTVLDVCEDPMILYRPGAITLEQILAVAGAARRYHPALTAGQATPESLPSPGVDLRHYAPAAHLVLLATEEELLARLSLLDPTVTGILLPDGWTAHPLAHSFPWGPWGRSEILAQRLFAGLRSLDAAGVVTILCPLPPESGGLSGALRDRLEKAARGR